MKGREFMDKTRIVIVDDSSFSITLLRNILEDNGFEVVGTAGNLEEVKEVVSKQRPTLVTMDMTLPGTDGFECTRAVHEIDKNIKVIVVSSMMDDEILDEAKKNKVAAYVQKPIDPDELITAIRREISNDELYEFLKEESFSVFKEAMLDGMNKMTKTLITYKDEYSNKKEHQSKGITIIIGVIGKFCGRVLIDMSTETARNLSTAVLRKEPKDKDEMIALLGEFTNIIAGNAASLLNRKNKALGLRLAPPSVLYGDSLIISAPNFKTTTAVAETEYGDIFINAGFQRGEE